MKKSRKKKQTGGTGDVFPREEHTCDFCVVGGGMAGVTAALAAARHGASVVLMHDRPVLGGNASSEIRVHICGADRSGGIPHMRETGILEELRLENLKRNPGRIFSIWDTILYEKLTFEENITLLLNCSCFDADMDGDRIVSATGWQLTTQTYHTVKASIFADCSGDGVLAPLTGADFRIGREARGEYSESIAPEKGDSLTMGMTIMFQAEEFDSPRPFEPLPWAYTYDSCDELPYGAKGHTWWKMGYWWVELGGEHDSIRDTERMRDELLKISYGVWDHIKNRCSGEAENWALTWMQFLPGKRESRRYTGVHVLTQNDIESGGKFEDRVAYGGWTMDDHHSAGFRSVKIGAPSTVFHPAPSPYGIPYRSLYSKNIPNLMFAGRCHSATHAAMSSTRVMGTGCSMGQAVGTAAAVAVKNGVDPEGVLGRVSGLQQMLLRDDAYIPLAPQEYSDLTVQSVLSASQGDPEPVRDGIHRQVGDDPHAWEHTPGDSVWYEFKTTCTVTEAVLILDTAMDGYIQMSYSYTWQDEFILPDVIPDSFSIDIKQGDSWERLTDIEGNYRRCVSVPVNKKIDGIRYTLNTTRGAERTRMYAFYVTPK